MANGHVYTETGDLYEGDLFPLRGKKAGQSAENAMRAGFETDPGEPSGARQRVQTHGWAQLADTIKNLKVAATKIDRRGLSDTKWTLKRAQERAREAAGVMFDDEAARLQEGLESAQAEREAKLQSLGPAPALKPAREMGLGRRLGLALAHGAQSTGASLLGHPSRAPGSTSQDIDVWEQAPAIQSAAELEQWKSKRQIASETEREWKSKVEALAGERRAAELALLDDQQALARQELEAEKASIAAREAEIKLELEAIAAGFQAVNAAAGLGRAESFIMRGEAALWEQITAKFQAQGDFALKGISQEQAQEALRIQLTSMLTGDLKNNWIAAQRSTAADDVNLLYASIVRDGKWKDGLFEAFADRNGNIGYGPKKPLTGDDNGEGWKNFVETLGREGWTGVLQRLQVSDSFLPALARSFNLTDDEVERELKQFLTSLEIATKLNAALPKVYDQGISASEEAIPVVIETVKSGMYKKGDEVYNNMVNAAWKAKGVESALSNYARVFRQRNEAVQRGAANMTQAAADMRR